MLAQSSSTLTDIIYQVPRAPGDSDPTRLNFQYAPPSVNTNQQNVSKRKRHASLM